MEKLTTRSLIVLVLVLVGCRFPGQDQYEHNHAYSSPPSVEDSNAFFTLTNRLGQMVRGEPISPQQLGTALASTYSSDDCWRAVVEFWNVQTHGAPLASADTTITNEPQHTLAWLVQNRSQWNH